MTRALIALSLLVAGCGAEQAATPAGPATNLLVTVDADGTGPRAAKESRVRCEDGSPCAADAVSAHAFEPVNPRQACTDIFGGPQTALVTGTLRGKPVSARFRRDNGCQIARWEAAAPLLGDVR
jgi:hypothetical protein